MVRKTPNSNALIAALGQAVYQRRREGSLSQDDLAAAAGLHRTYISEIERNARNLSVKVLAKIAVALETSPSALMKTAEELVSQQCEP